MATSPLRVQTRQFGLAEGWANNRPPQPSAN
jgi:hypothetical protein